jgi:sterol desaturase/sphingolipid hydroxylase (fatty acid hydroxylase superfamily)
LEVLHFRQLDLRVSLFLPSRDGRLGPIGFFFFTEGKQRRPILKSRRGRRSRSLHKGVHPSRSATHLLLLSICTLSPVTKNLVDRNTVVKYFCSPFFVLSYCPRAQPLRFNPMEEDAAATTVNDNSNATMDNNEMDNSNNNNACAIVASIIVSWWQRMTSGPTEWTAIDKIIFAGLICVAMEVLKQICSSSGRWMKSKHIPIGGKHLDTLSTTDKLFIGISKAQTGPFLYFLLQYCFNEPDIVWNINQMTFKNVVLPLPALFIVYDFFYTILHWALHIRAVYPYIHKHHHRQKAPSRATDDAVNVHPIEFTLGEYNHLLALYLCCTYVMTTIHIVGVLLFLAVGGILAGWNHTRYDITWNVLGVSIFDSKAHDVHHRIPQSNYGQYTMFWDVVFGTYRPYSQNQSVSSTSSKPNSKSH